MPESARLNASAAPAKKESGRQGAAAAVPPKRESGRHTARGESGRFWAESAPMPKKDEIEDVTKTVKKWKPRRGSLIMALHDLQDKFGYVPRDAALQLAVGMDVPLARIYEVITFYHYFKLEAPGKAVISLCTGTACYLKGSPAVLEEFEHELGVPSGQSTPDKLFHLQSVRCVGCCGLAPVAVVNGKTYGKLTPADVKKIVEEWKTTFAAEPAVVPPSAPVQSA